ncbi:MAG: protein-L-isoaspartate(D-aspartate) O-methyltransferase [Alphaproteobacteria bacterium]
MVTDGDAPTYAAARDGLMREIADEVAATAGWTGRAHLAPCVIEAMMRVPRHEFVPPDERAFAYANRPLPIGQGQTISQPYIVALMTDLLEVGAGDTVLEIGTGSGYQAAVLSELVRHVWSIETVPELAASAAERLARLGCDNVTVRQGDGALGWPEQAPFDGIIVTAQCNDVPPALVEQLAPDGRLVLPLGGAGRQMLTVVTKTPDGGTDRQAVLPVAFVPLT